MATITTYNTRLDRIGQGKVSAELIEQVKRAEKRTFPKEEAMNFDMELKKRNTDMWIVVNQEEDEDSNRPAPVVAYMLIARVHGVALLHKICVMEGYQRRGLARAMISKSKDRLCAQGCEKIQLWVDYQRIPAIRLYTSLGFKDVDRSRDYYGPGRHGLQMVSELNYIW